MNTVLIFLVYYITDIGLDEFVPLCRYLALPTNLAELFNLEFAPQMADLVKAWGSHPDVKPKLSNPDAAKILRYGPLIGRRLWLSWENFDPQS